MAVEDSLNQSMDEVVKRYSSLFRLPSYGKVLLLLVSSCLGAGVISAITLFPPFEARNFARRNHQGSPGPLLACKYFRHFF